MSLSPRELEAGIKAARALQLAPSRLAKAAAGKTLRGARPSRYGLAGVSDNDYKIGRKAINWLELKPHHLAKPVKLLQHAQNLVRALKAANTHLQ